MQHMRDRDENTIIHKYAQLQKCIQDFKFRKLKIIESIKPVGIYHNRFVNIAHECYNNNEHYHTNLNFLPDVFIQ